MLRAPVSVDGKIEKREIGTPQGGPISPILANILLNELDQELEARGHRFVRYADDLIILCKSKKSAYRTLERIKPFIEEKLFLVVNEEKTKVRYIAASDVKFLGFGFWQQKDKESGKVIIRDRPHQKSLAKCRSRLKELTARSRGQSLDVFRKKLKEYVRGWVGYYGRASMKVFVKETDEWLRRRIRQLYWKLWKKIKTKFKALRKLGMSEEQALRWANTRKSYWHTANSWILSTTLTNDVLKTLGWIRLADVYRRDVAPSQHR